jgi:hypothetical protein
MSSAAEILEMNFNVAFAISIMPLKVAQTNNQI